MINKKYKIIFIFLIASFFIQITYLQTTEITTIMEIGRTFEVKRLLNSCAPFPVFVQRPPLYLYVMTGVIGLVRYLHGFYPYFNLISMEILNIRLLSLFFGLLSIVAFFFLINEAFNRKTAIFSTFFLIVYPTYIKWSTLPLETTMFLLFLSITIFCIMRFKKRKGLNILLLAGFSQMVVCMLRLEGWILIPVLGIFLIEWRSYKPFLIFMGISLIFPVAWMLIDYYFTGDALYYLNDNDNLIRGILPLEHSSIAERIFFWPNVLNRELPFLLFPLVIIGLVYSLIKKMNFHLAAVSLFLIVIFTYKTVNHTLNTQDRLILPCGILFIPYAGIILEKLSSLRNKIFPVVIAIFLCFSGVMSVKKAINDRWIMEAPEREIKNWIIKKIDKEEPVLVGNVDSNFYGVVYYSGFNPCRSYVFDFNPNTEMQLEEWQELIAKWQPKYLILPKEKDELYNFINSSLETKDKLFLNYNFALLFSNNKYAVYKVGYY